MAKGLGIDLARGPTRGLDGYLMKNRERSGTGAVAGNRGREDGRGPGIQQESGRRFKDQNGKPLRSR